MANGYEKFFKQAQKATGLTKGKSSASAARDRRTENTEVLGRLAATPEERLRQAVAKQMMAKKKAKLKKKSATPVGLVIFMSVALLTVALAYANLDLVDSWMDRFNHLEITAFGFANAAEGNEPAGAPAKTAQAKVSQKAKTAESKDAVVESKPPSVQGWSEEELSFFSKLNERKKELDQRESELNKLEEELQQRQAELDKKLEQLDQMRTEISKTLKSRVADDQTKVDKLVQFYSGMKPQQAAKVIENLNEDLAVEVLDKLKKKNAAEIFDMMSPEKARRLSELLTGYQRTAASVVDSGATAPESSNETSSMKKSE